MVNTYIEQAIQCIESEREQLIAEARTKVSLEIAPQNAEIDALRDRALQEKQDKLNLDIAALQEVFVKERQEIIEASEKQKEENTNARINIETARITTEYNTKLAKLRELIEA